MYQNTSEIATQGPAVPRAASCVRLASALATAVIAGNILYCTPTTLGVAGGIACMRRAGACQCIKL